MHPDRDLNASTPEGEKAAGERSEWTGLYRGLWADNLKNGDLLPVGGSMFSEKLTLHLKLDFETFDPELANVSPERMRAAFEERRGALKQWLEKVGPKEEIDPYVFFVCASAQAKVDALLQVTEGEQDSQERKSKYAEGNAPALSELRGKTMCAERAALARYILQKMGMDAAYVGGSTMLDAKDGDEYPEGHSFIVIQDPTDAAATYVYDVARPRSQNRLPRLLKTDVPLTAELLAGKSELYVRSTEVLQGGVLWFGVGAPVAGEHDILENKER